MGEVTWKIVAARDQGRVRRAAAGDENVAAMQSDTMETRSGRDGWFIATVEEGRGRLWGSLEKDFFQRSATAVEQSVKALAG